MNGPDWDYWDTLTAFDCRDAAWLWFGKERPGEVREPDYPGRVRDLLHRIRSERDAQHRKDKKRRVYRQTLVSIADALDHRTPLLHPEIRGQLRLEETGEASADGNKEDSARDLLVMLEALLRLHRKRPAVLRLNATEQIRQLLNNWNEVQPTTRDGARPWDGEIPLTENAVAKHLQRIHRGEPF